MKEEKEETGARQIVTSEYNKLRTEEYLHLRGRFYKRFPKSLESDYNFAQEVFLHFDILQAEIKQLEKKNKQLIEILKTTKTFLLRLEAIGICGKISTTRGHIYTMRKKLEQMIKE